MKGITGNPALDAYDRMSVTAVSRAATVVRPQAIRTEQPDQTPAAKVTISSQAQELASTAAEAQVNTQKVDQLRAQINNGTYRVDTQLVASRVLDALG
jgi:flagellar biosynthesis anti-sigma factor FlgM